MTSDSKSRLPTMKSLRASAEELGLDISGYGRKRTAIHKLILQTRRERTSFTPPGGRGFVKRSQAISTVILAEQDE